MLVLLIKENACICDYTFSGRSVFLEWAESLFGSGTLPVSLLHDYEA